MHRLYVLALLFYLPFNTALAASFNCGKATSSTEKLICSEPNLSDMDEQYAKLYRQAKSQSTKPEQVKLDAIAALKQRESACSSSSCLEKWYRYRLFVLENKISLLSQAQNGEPVAEHNSAESSINCASASNNREVDECFARQVSEAEEVMIGYYNKSLERYAADSQVQQAIKEGQTAWLKYAEANCGAVWAIWRTGTIRNVKYLSCKMGLVQKRTYNLWDTFLTYADSTPAVAPEPFPVATTTY